MITKTVRQAIDSALLNALGPSNFDHVDVREDYDHAEEPALFLDVATKTGADRLGADSLVETQIAVSDALLALGETRFPYLSFKFPGDQYATDDIREAPSRRSASRS